ncbi:MAG: hypothetical protein M0Z46_14690 [Actinomycetota bacterium]|nr:hypothetical protein [Actinomycetota bacterium]
MTKRRRQAPFRRLPDGRIELDLSPGVREFMAAAAERLRETVEAPGSAAFERLYGRIDESADMDDPAYVLARQLAVDEIVHAVSASARAPVIDAGEAEAWLKVLGMTLSRQCAERGLRTEEDRAKLDAQDEAVIRVAYALQVGLIDALDDPQS